MKALLIVIGSCCMLFFTGCVGDRPGELDFFEIKIDSIRVGSAFGSAIVYGSLKTTNPEAIVDHGVRWSIKANQDETELINPIKKEALGAVNGQSFAIPIRDLAIDSTYYFQTYAEQNGGRLFMSKISKFSLGINLEVSEHLQINDTLLIQAELSGLRYFGSALNLNEFGILLEEDNPGGNKPSFTEKIPINEVSDGRFNFKIDSILFNQKYLVSLYARSNSKTWSSQKYALKTTGGWKKLPDLKRPLFASASLALNGVAIIGFGYQASCFPNGEQALEIFNPLNGGSFKPFSTEVDFPLQYPVMLAINNRLFCGLGEYQNQKCIKSSQCSMFEFNQQTGQLTWLDDCFPGEGRAKTAAFTVNGRGYVGAGERITDVGGVYQNDFWEFNPDGNNGKGTWRKIKSLPSREESELGNLGRQFPYVFQFSNRVFVGGGSYGSKYLNDIWEFLPPRNDSDEGDWKFVGFFPGIPRDEAASCTIGSKGYLTLGFHNLLGIQNDCWEFNPDATIPNQQWKKLSNFPAEPRSSAISFSLGEQLYIGGGLGRRVKGNLFEPTYPTDFWTYVPTK